MSKTWFDLSASLHEGDAIYTAPYIDIGFIDTVRTWATVKSSVGAGEIADPNLQVRHSLGLSDDDPMWDVNGSTPMWGNPLDPMWQSWGEWQDWTVGQIKARRIQHRIVYDPANGSPVIEQFTPIVDVAPYSESGLAAAVPAAGVAVTYKKQFHTLPSVKCQAKNAALVAVPSNETTTGFTLTIYDLATGSAVSDKSANWTANTL